LTERAGNPFDASAYKLNHTPLVAELRAELEGKGYTVFTEDQNYFTLRGTSGTTLSGKPDIVAIRGTEGIVCDAKTGSARESHEIQVLIYMWAIPKAFPEWQDIRFSGLVAYKAEVERFVIPPGAVDSNFVGKVAAQIKRLASPLPARKVPGPTNCRLCPIPTSICPERNEAGASVDVSEF
jgi:hypothetical protein